jgi:hypothetical protein
VQAGANGGSATLCAESGLGRETARAWALRVGESESARGRGRRVGKGREKRKYGRRRVGAAMKIGSTGPPSSPSVRVRASVSGASAGRASREPRKPGPSVPRANVARVSLSLSLSHPESLARSPSRTDGGTRGERRSATGDCQRDGE